MKILEKEYRTIWYEDSVVKIIDQTKLPHQFIIKELKTVKDAINAIKVMEVRGAPLIGGTAAYGVVLAVKENSDIKARLVAKGFRQRPGGNFFQTWCTYFITKTEVFFFLICALRIVIFGREFSLSTLTFHFFIYSFIRFFIYTLLLLLLLLWFTRGTVGRRLRYIVNDRGL